MATDAASALPQTSRLRKTPSRTPSILSRRSSTIFQGENVRSKDYWNNLMCMLSGLSQDQKSPAAVSSFTDAPSPPHTPVLRTRSSTNSVPSSKRSSSFLRPSFTSRHSSRNLLRRISTRGSGVSFQIEEEPVPDHPVSPCDTLPEEQLLPSAFECDILSTVPGPEKTEKMISFERDGKTIWMPAHVVDRYSSLAPPLQHSNSAGRLKISIPVRTASKAIKQQRHPGEEGQTLTLINTTSSQSSSVQSFQTGSPGASSRSNRSSSGSSADSPSVRTPGSIYSSDGTSLNSLELQTPTDTASTRQPRLSHKTSFSVIDPSKAGVFDELPPVQPRNPRRSNVDIKDFATAPTFVQVQGDVEDELLLIDSGSPEAVQRLTALYEPAREVPAVPQRSRRRASRKPDQRLTNRKSVGDMSLAVTAEQPESTRVTADAAESVILHLFLAATSLGDLFALAQINHGFHAVYKRYEYMLVKNALRNDCLAAWELRELTAAAKNDELANEHDSTLRYLESLRQDIETLQELKTAVLERCTSFLRRRTLVGLSGQDAQAEAEVDDALWHIWAFCARFHSQPAAVESQVAYLARSDLTAPQLYNMTEMWNCIAALLSGIASAPGALEQARAAGIISPKDDMDALETWVDKQRMRGPGVALDLASVAAEPSADVFALAAQMGWTGGAGTANAASAFLKDAVARAYAARLAAERDTPQTATPLEILSPTPVSPVQASPLSALEPDVPLDVVAIDESAVHPALRRQASGESCGFVTPPMMPSSASSSYSTRPVTPA